MQKAWNNLQRASEKNDDDDSKNLPNFCICKQSRRGIKFDNLFSLFFIAFILLSRQRVVNCLTVNFPPFNKTKKKKNNTHAQQCAYTINFVMKTAEIAFINETFSRVFNEWCDFFYVQSARCLSQRDTILTLNEMIILDGCYIFMTRQAKWYKQLG